MFSVYVGRSVSRGWSTLQHRHYRSKADHKRCSFAVGQGPRREQPSPGASLTFMPALWNQHRCRLQSGCHHELGWVQTSLATGHLCCFPSAPLPVAEVSERAGKHPNRLWMGKARRTQKCSSGGAGNKTYTYGDLRSKLHLTRN